ncbi:MAG TPA: TadE/TadG family type IV pilus assembly protein [Anaerolineae bacterium]
MLRFHSGSFPRPSGQSLVEFALTMPFLVLMIMGIFDLGWTVYAKNTLALGAREGARVGVVNQNDDAICAQVRATAQGLALTCSNVTVSRTTSASLDKVVVVSVNYTYQPLTPLIGNWLGINGNWIFSSSATMLAEY